MSNENLLLEPGVVHTLEEDRILVARMLQLQRRKLELAKQCGIAFYEPWFKQDAFHRAPHKRRLVRAGNRTGKSTMGCAEDCAWLMGERVWYPTTDDARYSGIPRRPIKGLVITTDWDKVNEIWTGQDGALPGKIWQFLPKDFVRGTKRNHSGAIETIFCKNDSILRFDTVESFKKNPMGQESSDWDFIHGDEPFPEGMWKATSRGLMDRGGSAWFTLTALSEIWINDMFFPRPGALDKTPSSRWSITASTYENPYLTKSDIEEFESSLTEDEKQCRIHGIPLELSGLVYKQFSYDKHVLKSVPKGWRDYNTPPKNYSIYYAVDVHPQTCHAVLFVAVSPHGQKFIYNELWVPERSIPYLAGMILRTVDGYNVVRSECDPLAWIEHPMTERCMADEFANNGVILTKAAKDKQVGIIHMQGELGRNDNVYVSPNLNRFLFEINRYTYDKENKPVDKDDHMMENMYRIFLNDPEWIEPGTVPNETEDEEFTDANFDLDEISIND